VRNTHKMSLRDQNIVAGPELCLVGHQATVIVVFMNGQEKVIKKNRSALSLLRSPFL